MRDVLEESNDMRRDETRRYKQKYEVWGMGNDYGIELLYIYVCVYLYDVANDAFLCGLRTYLVTHLLSSGLSKRKNTFFKYSLLQGPAHQLQLPLTIMPAIALDDVTVNNVGALKTINEYTLPTTYSEEFYSDAHANKFVQLGFYGEIAVGAIKAKPIVPQHHTTPTSVYIESIAVLEAYRGNGIGKKLVEYIIEKTKESYIHEVSLHVWKKESKVIEWYQKQGFEVVKEIEGYYKDHGLEDPDAVFMVKKF